MNFLKNLFGGGEPRDTGYYIYVRPKMCQEVLRVRIDLANSLSRRDDGDGYWVRKMVSGTRCPFQAEVTLYFDANRRMVDSEVTNGELVSEADYAAANGDAS